MGHVQVIPPASETLWVQLPREWVREEDGRTYVGSGGYDIGPVLAIAPEGLERQIRDKVADEIETYIETFFDPVNSAAIGALLMLAAEIARGYR